MYYIVNHLLIVLEHIILYVLNIRYNIQNNVYVIYIFKKKKNLLFANNITNI